MKKSLFISFTTVLLSALTVAAEQPAPIGYQLNCMHMDNFGQNNMMDHKDTFAVAAKLDSAKSLFSNTFTDARIGIMNFTHNNDIQSLRIDESEDIVILASQRFGTYRLVVKKTQVLNPKEQIESRKWYAGTLEYLNSDSGSSEIACTIQKQRI